MNLDHYLQTGTMKGVDLSECTLKKLSAEDIDKGANRSVTEDILTFYLAETGMALLQGSVSPKQELNPEQLKVAKMYMDVCSEVGPPMFYYLMHICIRENRHADTQCATSAKNNMTLTPTAINFMSKVRSIGDRTEIRLYVDNESYHYNTPDICFGELSDAVWGYFYHGLWVGGGFGGKKWAAVAKILQQFIHGKINTGLMIDQSANAAHNNGPIFNKHLVYANPSKNDLYRILDVQRAGEILPYVKSRHCKLVKEYHIDMLQVITGAVVENSSDTVNWEEVSKHGVKHNYVTMHNKEASKTSKKGEYSLGCYGSIKSIEERENG